MPRIQFVWLSCRCGAEHKVSIERVAACETLECISCGEALHWTAYVDALDAVRRYSEVVAELERAFDIEEDALRLRLSGKRVTVPLRPR